MGEKKSENALQHPIVLVGTYRPECWEFISKLHVYNLPFDDGDDNALKAITHLLLFAKGRGGKAYPTHFSHFADKAWLKDHRYPISKTPHAKRYAIFALDSKKSVAYGKLLGNKATQVFVYSSRIKSCKIDDEFYSKPYPNVGGESMRDVFDKLKPYHRKVERIVLADKSLTQVSFPSLLNTIADIPFPSPKNPKFTFIDLFAGIGGIRLGYQLNGGRCVFSSEWDKDAAKTYYYNFGEQPHGDIQKIDPKTIPDFDVLLAGFPCQPFSIIGDKEGFKHETQGTLFFNIEKILLEKKPKAFMLENVRNLTAHDNGRTFKVILSHLKDAGYDVHYKVLNALDYGVPQKRERIIICGFREKVDFEFPPPIPREERKTVADIIDADADQDKSLFVKPSIRKSRIERLKDKAFPRPYISHENVAGSITPHTFSCALRAGASANYILINDERRPSAREMLRIQGFPDEFKIVVNYGQIKHQTGNSVAVPVIRAVAERVVEKLNEL